MRKKHSILCYIALATAILMLVACNPTPGNDFTQQPTVEPTAEPTVIPTEEPDDDMIDGVYKHDYEKVRTFLEIKDENGIRNGEKLNPSYDPDDRTTWTYVYGSYDAPRRESIARWDEDGRLASLYFPALGLVGELDLSYCSSLRYITSENAIKDLGEISNSISTLNITGCNEPLLNVKFLGSGLERIIPDTILSENVWLTDNRLQMIDWRCKEDSLYGWKFNAVLTADGAGYVGIAPGDRTNYAELFIEATPEEGYTFIGWFNRFTGVLVSEEARYEISSREMVGCTGVYDYIARFE